MDLCCAELLAWTVLVWGGCDLPSGVGDPVLDELVNAGAAPGRMKFPGG
jgi:hypothetical protein